MRGRIIKKKERGTDENACPVLARVLVLILVCTGCSASEGALIEIEAAASK